MILELITFKQDNIFLFQAPITSALLNKRWQSVDFKQALLNNPETKVSTLNNKFRVASEDSGLPTCTVS
jgi:processing peptidase subunit beta